ncbi:MAG: hypothetical protein WC538_11620 [Thermoanaerobaculia bacterium]|jgi:hypothetical protein
MKVQIALPASALVLALSAMALLSAPEAQPHSQRGLVARAGIGAIRAIATADGGKGAPESTQSAAPLTLSASRPDSVVPVSSREEVAAIESYHELALESARESSATVVVDPTSETSVRSAVLVDFEKKCEQSATASKKPKCTTSELEMPVLGCYLQQAASAILS